MKNHQAGATADLLRRSAGRGVQSHEVWAAADAVLQQGLRPTIERVRQHLGRGSPNTVAPMLDVWFTQLGQRLGAGAATFGAAAPAAADNTPATPGTVQDLAQQLWTASLDAARQAAQAELQQAHAQLQQTRDTLTNDQTAWAQEQAQLRSSTAASAQLAQLARDHAAALQTRLDQAEAHASAREQQLTQLHERLEAAQAQHEAQRHQYDDERLTLAQERNQLQEAYSRNERLWLQELDNARQEAKQNQTQTTQAQGERDALAQQLQARLTQLRDLAAALHSAEQQAQADRAHSAQLAATLTQEREQHAAWLALQVAAATVDKANAATTPTALSRRVALTPGSRARRR
jgi:hypothetical protein